MGDALEVRVLKCLCRWAEAYYLAYEDREIIEEDIKAFKIGAVLDPKTGFIEIFRCVPEFRSLFYHRYRLNRSMTFSQRIRFALLQKLFPGAINLFIETNEIGAGLFIQHGFSTIIAAERIGSNCRIGQQVTIGKKEMQHGPRIGDSVEIYAGAIIIGNIDIGNRAIIGAGAVVVKDVPSDTIVVSQPARYMYKKDKNNDL